ncbi:hypothetical protein [Nocardioides panaciterrulae]|uniref:Lipoprotein n=1 Tax=Nocardioides panaciterrulae TaxID=661492 RepID=A0A7Y9EA19_9ACTN|nr:hypothetical protein [Nocardioides panaciterrulae]NYD43859.1 hypothetical protein [Nocardioides panaciterrulae]
MMCDVRLTSGAWLVVAALLLAGGVTGCAEDTAEPLRLQGNGGMVVDPVDTGVWFRTSGCLAKGSNPLDVMVTGVTTSPRNGHVATLATWNDDSPVVLAKPGRPPAAYEPVTATSHTGGTLAGCSLDIAVVLSPDSAPVVVRTVTVHYEVDGEARSARTALDAVLCPAGTHASGRGEGCDDS